MQRTFQFGAPVLVALLLSGCFSYSQGQPASISPVAPLHTEAWPPRDLDAVRSFYEATPERIFRYALQPGATIDQIDSRYARYVNFPSFTVHGKVLTNKGVGRLYTEHGAGSFDSLDDLLFGFTPNASFLSCHEVRTPRFEARMAELDEPDSSQRLLEYFGPGLDLPRTAQRVALRRGVPMHIPIEIPPHACGILLHFTSLYGNEYERRVLDVLRRDGWVTASISTQSSLTPPPRDAHAARREELRAKHSEVFTRWRQTLEQEARSEGEAKARLQHDGQALRSEMMDLARQIAEVSRGSYQVRSDDDIRPVAHELARAIDEKLAENAYAAEAALTLLRQQHPDLADAPVVVIGFSAGSLAAPAAAVWLGEAIDAVILVAGGSNILAISNTSTFQRGTIPIRDEDEHLPPDVLSQLSDAYLGFSRLDPHHLAGHLQHIPVLVVRASHDKWISARAARELAEQLGAPSQLRHLGGHRSLFYFLPSQARRIGRWIDGAVIGRKGTCRRTSVPGWVTAQE